MVIFKYYMYHKAMYPLVVLFVSWLSSSTTCTIQQCIHWLSCLYHGYLQVLHVPYSNVSTGCLVCIMVIFKYYMYHKAMYPLVVLFVSWLSSSTTCTIKQCIPLVVLFVSWLSSSTTCTIQQCIHWLSCLYHGYLQVLHVP